MIYPGFIGAAYRAQSLAAAGDICTNLYLETMESSGASQAVLYGTPGTRLFVTLPKSPMRGIVNLPGPNGDQCYAIGGDTLYRVNGPGKSPDALGSGLPQPGSPLLPFKFAPVSMQTNGNQVAIAVGGQLWVWDGSTLSQVDTSLVAGAVKVSYSDGYFIVNVPNTNQFNISGLFDATSWNALDFGSTSGFPEPIVGHVVDHRELWLYGSRHAEIYWNSGDFNFPWQRIQGPYIEAGLGAKDSLVKVDNTHIWLHQDERGGRMIWRANGYTPQRVSNFALEYAMSTYARVDDAVAFPYQERGHTFYQITFPSAILPGGVFWDSGVKWDSPGVYWDQPVTTSQLGATWALDLSNGLWHQRDYIDPRLGVPGQVRGWCHAYAFGRHLVGDYENGNIYDQSLDYFTDYYNPTDATKVNRIRRLRRAPHINKEHRRIFYPGFELHIQQGTVPQSGDGSAPKFSLRKSPDGGFTWSNYVQVQAGAAGEYRRRLLWRQLGNARDAVFEASSDEPIQHAWIDAYFNPEPVISPL